MSAQQAPSRQHRIAEFLLGHYALYIAVLRPLYLLRRHLSRVRP
ncbi:MAG: hypothetical protein PHU75_07665 [Candidatus Nanopelagicales bacterium]|nr:hypothetical protein [Candidatus Nanopelagicales bacterium]